MTNTKNGTFRICREVTISYRDFICNILSDGMDYFSGYGFRLLWNEDNFQKAKSNLSNQNLDASLEDILTEMILSGEGIKFIDREFGGEYTSVLTLDKVEKAFWRFLEEEPSDAFQLAFDRVYHEEYDAEDCDVLLQYILFDEYMFS